MHLVECKQVTCKDGKGRLAFKRLKQMSDLIAFEKKFEFHKSWFCIAFKDKYWRDSEVYLVPAMEFKSHVTDSMMSSINRHTMKDYFGQWQIEMRTGNLFDLTRLKQ